MSIRQGNEHEGIKIRLNVITGIALALAAIAAQSPFL
jgi:hypothetical protein